MSRESGSSLGLAYRKAGPYLGLGVEFIAAILLCLFAGRWVDEKLGTSPFLTLFGALLGMAAGFYNLYKTSLRLQQRDREEKEGGP